MIFNIFKASQEGHLHVVEYLINHGANKEIKQLDGWTALLIGN